ncbi:Holliday junction branch migration protein RuvA [Gammaproteobacteria bacterium]|nr:Holliday junction branch migration protein RuvA [Gammaproteobacteria bacterium]
MISRIKGILLEKDLQQVLVDVQGVAYEIEVPMNTLFQLPEPGNEVILNTHFVVREDAQLLYGFFDKHERSLFRILIKINGVGPKLALAILSGMTVGELVTYVHGNDVNALVRLPGVGKKTAERLIIELRDKLKDWDLGAGKSEAPTPPTQSSHIYEAETALISLGYKPQEASRAVNAAAKQLEQDEQYLLFFFSVTRLPVWVLRLLWILSQIYSGCTHHLPEYNTYLPRRLNVWIFLVLLNSSIRLR